MENGRSISILEDPWLPLNEDAYIHTNNATLQGRNVSSLISITDNTWDTDLVLDMFDTREASIILSVPLNTEVEDTWFWRKEKLGNYSVKSAYLIMEENRNDNSTNANSGFWRKLWNLKIPPKV